MDGSGTLTADEMRQAMKTLGFGMLSAAEIGRLVARFDGDGDGLVGYLELNSKLRQVDITRPPKHKLIRTSEATAYKHEVWQSHALPTFTACRGLARCLACMPRVAHVCIEPSRGCDVDAPPPPQDGKMIRGRSEQERASKKLGISLDASSEASLQEQLRDALAANGKRVVDIFRAFDRDSEGTISIDEFEEALTALGFTAPSHKIRRLFQLFDPDGSGSIE
eukprot:4366960-Prymnesium_polylepis.1